MPGKAPQKPLFTPEQTKEYLARIASQYVINPLVLMNGGLKPGDDLVVELKPGESINTPEFEGVNLYAQRKGGRLLWQTGPLNRANSGRDVLLPFVRTWGHAGNLVSMIAEATGLGICRGVPLPFKRIYPLVESEGEVRRILPGDEFTFKGSQVLLRRTQPYIDMNLQLPDADGLIRYKTEAECGCTQPHHFLSVAQILTEANALKHAQRNGSFLAVK